MCPVRLLATAGLSAGSTPTSGSAGCSARSSWMAAAVAVLQATTSALMPVSIEQVARDRAGPPDHEGIAALAVGRVARVGKVDEAFVRQFGPQRVEDAEAPDAAVEHADRRWAQASSIMMVLNSPLAMRFCHSAGPVMWALVPPASTATVTGMSTTSNS